MTKMTLSGLRRRFDQVVNTKGPHIIRREEKLKNENVAQTLCQVCGQKMIVQTDGQMKRSHGGACRKEMRKNPSKYHKCEMRLCTGRKFEEIGGLMICEKMKLDKEEYEKAEAIKAKELLEKDMTEVSKVKRKE